MTYGLGILSAWVWRVKDFQVFFSASCSQKRKGLGGTRGVPVSKITGALLGSSGPKARGRGWAAQGGFIFLPAAFPEALTGQDIDNLGADLGHCLQAFWHGRGKL